MSNEKKQRKSGPPKSQQYARYLPIVEFVVRQSQFDFDMVKQACEPEKPAFVKRIVKELVEQGWLLSEKLDGDAEHYRWNSGRGEFSATRWLDEKLFGNQVTASPEEERPRERLLSQGVENLRTSELMAILIRSGRPGESAVMAAEKLARTFDGKLERLATAGRGELKTISNAIEKTAYCQIMAGIELGRRIAAVSNSKQMTKIGGVADAIAFCQRHFERLAHDLKQEEFHIVTLDTKHQVIDTHRITVGTLDASLVHPREVFRAAIKDASSAIILVHNHPSGDPTPSPEDIRVTDRLTESGKILGINVLDHIVVGRNAAASIRSGERVH